ncbi:LysR substrate-binding domain-containing protein [Vibrio genomosp. F10 str. 9ZC157]|uniref:Transcriptional regulator n=1 Tax=Vibrio genomosp. F10 str. ZF-129 TaxID=1187848 RepID=A0A1E5BBK6_9VIBR|nr:LysR substrate-binding domain-containing protein [Vibrio genomosp. F10]OEE31596.1 transcriptional regulator [Vibrio genomosp. F10 str. ZF-129]OEE95221.1 transcriptional regulator [Vibrio genomosp. F10 str. 9ZC157]
MNERMPPFQGIYYFYTAAELGSFKAAATQLFVTPAAISQQIRLLEEWLETDLFIRQHRQVVLTHEGEILYLQAKKGFAHLQDGIRQVNQDPNPTQLSISTLPSFAQHWLVPRIGQFKEAHPELSMLIEPSNQLVSFLDSSVDICIRYGEGNYKNVESRWLMDEVVYPVCHPIYQEKKTIYGIEDLYKAELIEDRWPDMDWKLWLDTVEVKAGQSTLQYDGSHFVLEGALSVQGVALVKHSLARRYIEEGKLVRIGNIALKPRFSYYLCAPAGYFRREKILQFEQWIKQQIRIFSQLDNEKLIIKESDYSLKWKQN